MEWGDKLVVPVCLVAMEEGGGEPDIPSQGLELVVAGEGGCCPLVYRVLLGECKEVG